MPVCSSCKEEVEEVLTVKVKGRNKKLCEDCADLVREEAEIAEASEEAVRDMMGYKGRW